jgi:hypothetical protein
MNMQLKVTEGAGRLGTIEPISVRITDAIRITGLSRSRIYELIKAGDLEIIKVGASTLVLVASLRGFIEGRRGLS